MTTDIWDNSVLHFVSQRMYNVLRCLHYTYSVLQARQEQMLVEQQEWQMLQAQVAVAQQQQQEQQVVDDDEDYS